MASWVVERLRQFGNRFVAVGESERVSYAKFVEQIERWQRRIAQWDIVAGEHVGLVADYCIDSVALFQALLESGCIVVPLTEDERASFGERLSVSCATRLIFSHDPTEMSEDTVQCQTLRAPSSPVPELMEPLTAVGRAGLVIFTSGSTGKGKAVLLDYSRMTKKYREVIRPSFRTLLFLKLDHIGGLNTLFSVIYNGGTIVTSRSRQVQDICLSIETNRVELLPTTPSFLNMLLISGMAQRYDLSSLKVVTYGTEVMPASTLAQIHRLLPDLTLKQTYGLSELGILSTKSKSSDSKWMKIGGAGVDLKVIDGVLWIKSEQAMLGYLNAPSPFDADGWYNTGDQVEIDGEYFRILGRESEIINVAGEKVYPTEVESFLFTLENVSDVVVRSKKSPVVGQMVWADFVLKQPEDKSRFKRRVIQQCQANFPPFKVPGLITVSNGSSFIGTRGKKIRKAG
jgi:acyl-CoA synthetase (AMP-forming)/AMP-acid ligase II